MFPKSSVVLWTWVAAVGALGEAQFANAEDAIAESGRVLGFVKVVVILSKVWLDSVLFHDRAAV